MRYPPSANEGQTSAIILLWRAWQRATLSSDHCERASSSLRNIPSPEQGTSATTMSKKPGIEPKAFGSTDVTTAEGSPHTAALSARTAALCFIISLEISRYLPLHAALRLAETSVVFPPGAAQRSSTLTPFPEVCRRLFSRTFRNTYPGNIAEES